jgi:hypothetical protein
MTLNDDAILSVGRGDYYTAPTGTDYPTDPLAVTAPWNHMGHTALEEFFAWESEGGEATVIGSLQSKALRTKYSARTDAVKVSLHQFDSASLRFYHGSNAPRLANGLLGVPVEGRATVCAFLAVFQDGANFFAVWAPRVEIYRGDNQSMGDGESMAAMPVSIKPMIHGQNDWTYAITPLGEMAGGATGATAGSPGLWTPSGSTAPADLATLQASTIAATPATAWTTGQYVDLANGSDAHWDGDTWEAGAAS